jgi:hypothetical protein
MERLLDKQDFRIFVHREAAVAEDAYGLVVTPVMDDPPENIHIATRRHRLKHVSGQCLKTGHHIRT